MVTNKVLLPKLSVAAFLVENSLAGLYRLTPGFLHPSVALCVLPASVPEFICSYYNAEELKELLNCPIRLVMILAAYYGLRSSEGAGIEMVDGGFYRQTVSIRHKILEEETPKGTVLKGYTEEEENPGSDEDKNSE